MFYLTFEKGGTIEINVVRATSSVFAKHNVKNIEEIKSPGDVLTFNTDMRTNRVKDALNAFDALNKYVTYRGDKYIEDLFKEYEKIHEIVSSYILASERDSDSIKDKFSKELSIIIEKIDIDNVYRYITQVNKVPIPSNLMLQFDTQIESDGLMTRDQTYIVNDYRWLMSLIVIFKATYGPLANLMYGSDDHVKKHADLQMLDIFKQQPIAKHPSFKKLVVYVKAIVIRTFKKEKSGNIKVLSTGLPKEVIPELYLSKAIFNKMVTMDLMADPNQFDIVRYLYKDVKSKIKNVGNPSEAIRNKKPVSGAEDEDKESVVESYRIATEIPPGIGVELNWVTDSIPMIIQQLPTSIQALIQDEHIRVGKRAIVGFTPVNISNTHINILGFLFKVIIDPRGLPHLKANNIYNLIVVGYAILMAYDIKPLAYLLVSKRSTVNDDDSLSIVSNLNTAKAKGYRDEEISKLFPVRKVEIKKNGEETPSGLMIVSWVSVMYIEINKYNWITPAELSIGTKDILISTLKNSIIDMLIEHEKRII